MQFSNVAWRTFIKRSTLKENKFGICCLDGEIEIPLLPQPPNEIQKLLDENDDKSQFFKNNIRAFNSALAMSSLGAKQQHLPKGGPSIFKIQCTVSHLIGSLLPINENEASKFVQIYIYDNENEIDNRLKALNDLDNNVGRSILHIAKCHKKIIFTYKNSFLHMNV